MAEDIEEM
jgi:hypothetical protein